MLKSRLLHPEILEAFGRAGHSSKILIADGNYPSAAQLGPGARLVSLNLSPGSKPWRPVPVIRNCTRRRPWKAGPSRTSA